jgi:hypothetical protein
MESESLMWYGVERGPSRVTERGVMGALFSEIEGGCPVGRKKGLLIVRSCGESCLLTDVEGGLLIGAEA